MNVYDILLWLNAVMETPALMVNDIFNKDAAYASVRRCIKSFTSCTSVVWTLDSLLNYARNFVVNWIEVGLFGGHISASL